MLAGVLLGAVPVIASPNVSVSVPDPAVAPVTLIVLAPMVINVATWKETVSIGPAPIVAAVSAAVSIAIEAVSAAAVRDPRESLITIDVATVCKAFTVVSVMILPCSVTSVGVSNLNSTSAAAS